MNEAIGAQRPGATGTGAMLASIETRIAALGLDLSGLEVVTEAATGAYACTATIAAMAGARRVVARARGTARHGTARDAARATLGLAQAAGVVGRIEVVDTLADATLATCDILTNSGHLRPITRGMIELLPRHAVIGLMFEAWEFRGADLDLAAYREFGIRVAAVNERHPDVAVFPFLGPLCVRLLAEATITQAGSRIALVCDNPFAPFIRDGLAHADFSASLYDRVAAVPRQGWDAVVVALDPGRNTPLDAADFAHLAEVATGARLAQFWGDLDRAAAAQAGPPSCRRFRPAQATWDPFERARPGTDHSSAGGRPQGSRVHLLRKRSPDRQLGCDSLIRRFQSNQPGETVGR